MSNKWKDDRDTSPDRTVVWTEPLHSRFKYGRKVPVVYYLSCNGQLQHPHFIEVHLSSPDGLYLRDVINRLNFLRGKGMASMYSWSCKRSYRNGYVWHDLAENDFIYPAHGQEYVLKGSELLEGAFISKSDETVASSTTKNSLPGIGKYGGGEVDFPAITRRRHQSFDLHEYKVYKTDSTGDALGRTASDAATQTDDKRRRRRAVLVVEEEEEEKEREEKCKEPYGNCKDSQEIIPSTELSKDEIPPPPSDSSPETLETLMKADGTLILRSETVNVDQTAANHVSGKSKASSVFMQFLKCGPMSFNDCGPGYGKEHGFGLVSHYKARLPRGGRSNQVQKGAQNVMVESTVVLEDKEYFSGSLVETKKTEFPALKRSSSYNADRLRR